MTSTTESMIIVDPTQKNVATIASPGCGLLGLKPLIRKFPLWASVPTDLLSETPFGEYENDGMERLRSGLVDSVQLTANSANATSPARDATAFSFFISLPGDYIKPTLNDALSAPVMLAPLTTSV